ncbi:LysM peptidoglycan-binding domain-containing protein [Microbacterium timonense]|uniref:LysM peptidoglycan-binding domain-containing protein n=1 Tax=Microbacterium timonense TaxID=2086576 RepID=UPI000D106DEF|nr:LysM domain-containing protein [Microbacterium timonense]
MNLAGKITVAVVVLVLGGLAVLAATVVGSIEWSASDVSNLGPTPEPSTEPVVESVGEPTPEPTPRDPKQAAAWAIGCDDFVTVGRYYNGVKPPRPDRGATEYASGTVTFTEDGGVDTYTVAEGDTGASIGERFCVDYITLYLASGVRQGMIHPGQVLRVNG